MSKLLLVSLFLSCYLSGIHSKLALFREWAELEYVFPSEEAKQSALNKGFYQPGPINNIPLDVDVHYTSRTEKRVFISIPRFGPGRPITFGVLDSQGRVHAYPNYTWHDNQGSNCEGLSSVFRTTIDRCNRLWVLDAGRVANSFNCKPKLLAFDLNTDQVVFTHHFNESSYVFNSLYITPVADVRNANCSGTFVYAADVKGNSLGVVDVDKNLSWRITHRLFYPYPSSGTFVIDGDKFDLMDGLFGLALSPLVNGDRKLYFHALSSVNENVVATSVIRQSSFIENSEADPDSIVVLPGTRLTQSAAEAMDSRGILYYGIMNPPSIWCWNSHTRFSRENFHYLAVDRVALQFASGVKIVVNKQGQEELWVTTSSIQRAMIGTMTAARINFRVHTAVLAELLIGSPCLLKKNNSDSALNITGVRNPPPVGSKSS